MKQFFNLITKFFSQVQTNRIEKNVQNVLDYSAKERVKLLRAAGREAQQEQLLLLQKYDAKFGQL